MRLLALFGLVAQAEMATFLRVRSRIGPDWAQFLALATALIGSVLVRRTVLTVLGQLRRREA